LPVVPAQPQCRPTAKIGRFYRNVALSGSEVKPCFQARKGNWVEDVDDLIHDVGVD